MSFALNTGKKIGKNISKSLGSEYSQKLLDHAKQSATDAYKIASKKQFRKHQKYLEIWLAIELLIKLKEPQKLHHKLNQLQMKKLILDVIEKYLEKDANLQKKESKLLKIKG